MFQLNLSRSALVLCMISPFLCHSQIVSDQNIEMKNKILQMEGGNITFKGGNNSTYIHYVDIEGDYWLSNILNGVEMTKNGGDLRLHGGDLELHSTAEVQSDPTELSSDIILRSNDDLIIHLDDNVMEGHNELGAVQILAGSGQEVVNLSESGHLMLRQTYNVGWSGFCNNVTNGPLGITLTEFNSNTVNLYASGSDLTMAFNGKNMAYVSDQDGKLYSAVSCTSMSPGVSLNKSAYNVLDKVVDLPIYASTYKSASKGLQVEINQLAQHFPDTVERKGENVAIAHSDFGLIALKAIQEQQQIIDGLKLEVARLSKDN